MKPIALEWIKKAEGDFATAQRELRARKNPNFDAACFHAQQCAEKYLKAGLQEAEIPFPRTHDLILLLDLLLPVEPLLKDIRMLLAPLASQATVFRYPGESSNREMATTSVRDCASVRQRMRQYLRLGN